MGEIALATQLITMQFAAFAFMIPLGISVGVLGVWRDGVWPLCWA